MNKTNRPLTEKERDVLLEIAQLNGPQWKTLLAEVWETRRYFNLKGVTLKNCQYLHRLGIEMGAFWLKTLNIEELKNPAEDLVKNAVKKPILRDTGQKRRILRVVAAEMSLILRELIRLEDLRSQGQDEDLNDFQDQWKAMLGKAREVVSYFPKNEI